eukprot:826740-Lingulodinium_polyedra.AAC.1
MDGWTDGRTDGRMDGWMDEWMDGWTDGWIDGWMDGDRERARNLGTRSPRVPVSQIRKHALGHGAGWAPAACVRRAGRPRVPWA